MIPFFKTAGQSSELIPSVCDYLVWYAKDIESVKYVQLYGQKDTGGEGASKYTSVELPDGNRRRMTAEEISGVQPLPTGAHIFRLDNLVSQGVRQGTTVPYLFDGRTFYPGSNAHWKTTPEGLDRLAAKRRLQREGNSLAYVRYLDDFPVFPLGNVWSDVGGIQSRTDPKVYAVQTSTTVVARAVLMTTLPGDIVFDPTCGSGTTAYCAERWGRRWITCDSSRVAINVARKRLLSAIFDNYRTRDGKVGSGFAHKTVNRITLSSLAHDLEPEKVGLVDQPEIDRDAVRVSGPFEVMTLGRYSVEDWKGYVRESGKLENYITTICRLYRKDAAVQGTTGLVHATSESETEKLAISVGPLTGRVTARQVMDASEDAMLLGIPEVHILGWAFEANVGEIKTRIESGGRRKVELIMIRPDTLAEGLKAAQSEMLFSPLALPDVEVVVAPTQGGEQEAMVELRGVGVFDRKKRTTDYYPADSGYVSAWYLDEDYDGDCFVDCQMFFDFGKTPNIKAALRVEVDPEEYKLQLTSQPFPVGHYKKIAVKVIDVYGNESTVVQDLA